MYEKPSPKRPERAPWRKPRLERLGAIRDIAGPPIPFLQATGNKHS